MNARFTSQSDIRGYGSNVCFVPNSAQAHVRFVPQADTGANSNGAPDTNSKHTLRRMQRPLT